jgi:hypothetical protein
LLRIAFCETNRLFILLERVEKEIEIRFSMAKGTFKNENGHRSPRSQMTTVKILTHHISRYKLPVKLLSFTFETFGKKLAKNCEEMEAKKYKKGLR